MTSTREMKNDATDRIEAIELAFLKAPLQSAKEGLDDLLVAIDGEKKGHVDVHAARSQLFDRGYTSLGGRNLDHDVAQR